jgi:small subunit ribosomal protein S17
MTKAVSKPTKSEGVQAAPQTAAVVDDRNSLQRRRAVTGTVVSDKMQKTIVVRVDRQVRHSLYKKYVEKTRRYKAHDEKNEAKIGDRVSLVESRPLSREKRWVLQTILRKAGQAPLVNV